MCFPISDNDEVIGVAELCNKQSGSHFTKFDEEMAMAFSSYCGLAILHSLMYKKVVDAQHRSKLSNELMMYHMKVSARYVTEGETHRLHLLCTVCPAKTSQVDLRVKRCSRLVLLLACIITKIKFVFSVEWSPHSIKHL